MSEQKPTGWMTIRVPYTEEPCGLHRESAGTYCRDDGTSGINAIRGGRVREVSNADVWAALLRAWPGEREQTDRAKRLAEIEALLAELPGGVWSWERDYVDKNERRDSWTLYVDRGEPITAELPRGFGNEQHGYNILGGADFDRNGPTLRTFVVAARQALPGLLDEVREADATLREVADLLRAPAGWTRSALPDLVADVVEAYRESTAAKHEAQTAVRDTTDSLVEAERLREVFDRALKSDDAASATDAENRAWVAVAEAARRAAPADENPEADAALVAAGIPEDMGSIAERVALLQQDADQQTSLSTRLMEEKGRRTDVVVIENVEPSGTTWFVSFDGHNPEPDRCVACASREDAFRLKAIMRATPSHTAAPAEPVAATDSWLAAALQPGSDWREAALSLAMEIVAYSDGCDGQARAARDLAALAHRHGPAVLAHAVARAYEEGREAELRMAEKREAKFAKLPPDIAAPVWAESAGHDVVEVPLNNEQKRGLTTDMNEWPKCK